MSNKYNGWSNYETWRVNLEFCDDGAMEYYTNADSIKDYVVSYIEESSEGIARSYALAFLDEVNWHEIAENYEERLSHD